MNENNPLKFSSSNEQPQFIDEGVELSEEQQGQEREDKLIDGFKDVLLRIREIKASFPEDINRYLALVTLGKGEKSKVQELYKSGELESNLKNAHRNALNALDDVEEKNEHYNLMNELIMLASDIGKQGIAAGNVPLDTKEYQLGLINERIKSLGLDGGNSKGNL